MKERKRTAIDGKKENDRMTEKQKDRREGGRNERRKEMRTGRKETKERKRVKRQGRRKGDREREREREKEGIYGHSDVRQCNMFVCLNPHRIPICARTYVCAYACIHYTPWGIGVCIVENPVELFWYTMPGCRWVEVTGTVQIYARIGIYLIYNTHTHTHLYHIYKYTHTHTHKYV